MKVSQYHYHSEQWFPELPCNNRSQLLLVFGCKHHMRNPVISEQIRAAFNCSEIVGCTTSGEILETEVYDETLVITAIDFERTTIEVFSQNLTEPHCSYEAGKTLASKLPKQQLKYVLVISDGQIVNGTELVEGINESLPDDVLVTGGMAGDGDKFIETVVWHNDMKEPGNIVLCGFYGDAIRLGHGTLGGWSSFGPDRFITRSNKNVLYELDNQPALDLYKKYLGDFSEQLPSSALHFPLSLQLPGETESVVRTILKIDEENKSMTFAGDMPEGAKAKLMKSSFDSLIDGASNAAFEAVKSLQSTKQQAELALLISCVGRRLVLKQRTYEELDAVNDITNDNCLNCGFYSYGEISPLLKGTQCRLHNQTMTITTFSEVLDA